VSPQLGSGPKKTSTFRVKMARLGHFTR